MTEYIVRLSLAGVIGWSVVLVAVVFASALRWGAVADRARDRRATRPHRRTHPHTTALTARLTHYTHGGTR